MTGAGPIVLVTGGAGFIGSRLGARLLRRGHRVRILDDLSRSGSAWSLERLRGVTDGELEVRIADLRDAGAVQRAVEGVDVVVHLAGQTAVTTSLADPVGDFEVNALGTVRLLDAIRHRDPPPAVLYASTNKVYGELAHREVRRGDTRWDFADGRGVTEDDPALPLTPYACSKRTAEDYVLEYHRAYGVPGVVLRQSCVYGPGQLGLEDQGWVAWFAIAAVTERPITVFGDGRQVRDLLYVDDLLDAYDAVLEHLDRCAGGIYNVGGGAARSVSVWTELAPLLGDALGRPLGAVSFAGARPGDQRVFYADTARLERDTAWSPRTDVPTGLTRLLAWITDHVEEIDRMLPPASWHR